MENPSIEKKMIKDIKGHFIIPSYQRGYKWTDIQVLNLLDDIWEHSQKNPNSEYCLQPVVISEGNIIDGQQRFTTIFIILKYFEKEFFTLFYNTRPDSYEFLKDIAEINNPDERNPDYYHMSVAYFTIKNWFEKSSCKPDKEIFLEILLEKTFFVWYEIESNKSNASDIFSRINMGKIPLTNAELVRAIILKSSNFTSPKGFQIQNQIATEWEEFEHQLQDDEFWYFLCANNTQAERYQTRLEFILDIIANKNEFSEKTDFFTFNYFYKKIRELQSKSDGGIELQIWTEIGTCFQKFKEWFEDNTNYNYIGYLNSLNPNKIPMFIKSTYVKYNSCKCKPEFGDWIKEEIKKSLDLKKSLEELYYGEDNSSIHRVLLLFNIQSNIDNGEKFSFKNYKTQKFSLEHIHARLSQDMTPKEMKEWIKYHKEFLKNNDQCQQILDLKDQDPRLKDLFDKCFDSIYTDYKSQLENIDNLGNLTLLEISANSALSNSIFPVKKQKIQDQKDVLLCTKNVFNKNYSKTDTGTKLWTQKDATDYLNVLKNTLKDFITNKNEE